MIERLFFNNEKKAQQSKNTRFKIKYSDAGCFERTPKTDMVSFKGISKQDAIKEMLDTKVFEFKKYDGKTYLGTIREYLKDSLVSHTRIDRYTELYHAAYTTNSADRMVEEGLNWRKTGRTKCGPGTYFCESYIAGAESCGASLRAIVEGRYIGKKPQCPIFETCFYDAITSNPEIGKSIKQIDGSRNVYETINEYCHDILADEMGIDILLSSSGMAGPCYVVLNDKSVRIKRYDPENPYKNRL